MLLVTMVFTAVLIDHSEGFIVFARRRRSKLENEELPGYEKETRSLMEILKDLLDDVDEQLDARAQEVRDPEEQEGKKSHVLLFFYHVL